MVPVSNAWVAVTTLSEASSRIKSMVVPLVRAKCLAPICFVVLYNLARAPRAQAPGKRRFSLLQQNRYD